MFRRKKQFQLERALRRAVRLKVDQLEARCVPHTGVTVFTNGITADSGPAGIILGPDGNFWFAEVRGSRIARITPTGVVTEFPLPAGRGPLNLAVGPDSNIWFTENTGDRIGRINPLAATTSAIQASIVEFGVPGAGSAPHDIAAGPDGAMWFTESGSDEIGRITAAGTITNEFAVPGIGSAPAGIAAGADGALWFTEAGAGQIGRVTVNGGITEFNIPVPQGNNVSDPEDITAGPNNALYFTDFGRDQIGRITTSGVITQFNLPIGRGPQNITAAPDGDLYFTEAASGRIARLPAHALAVGATIKGSPPLEEFDFIPANSTPLGIAVDAIGDIFFTLNAANGVGTFQAHLAQITVTSTGTLAQVFDRNLKPVSQFTAFPGFLGTFTIAVANIRNHGVPDSIVGAGPGGGPHVKVFETTTNQPVVSFFAFHPSYTGGVFVAADDVNGDERPDIIVATNSGGAPYVKVINGTKLDQVEADGQISNSALLAGFYAFDPSFRGGVSLAVGDVNADGKADIIVGAGAGGAPHVKVIDATKLNQVQPDGQIMASALLSTFFAFNPGFAGGVSVGFGFNDVQRKIIVGAGPGGGPHVRVIKGAEANQLQPNGEIALSALAGSFFAFDPRFNGGVRVSGDDVNSDGFAEIMVAAGPGGGPHVKVVDGDQLTQISSNGQILDSALFATFFSGDPSYTGGVFIASDADHRDGTIFGPPGVTPENSRRDINDVFVFRSPVNADNSVLIMNVSPFSTATTLPAFTESVAYELRVANRDLVNTTDDLTFRVTFGPPDANNVQDVAVRALPAVRFPASGGVIAKGLTGTNIPLRGVGGTGGLFRAGEQDDPFFFDAGGFSSLLNSPTAVEGVVAGRFPRGTSPNGFGPGSTPNYDAPNFFGPSVNTLSMILELPSARLTRPGSNVIGVWGRTELNGVQLDRMGRPGINTALIPPVPRGTDFPPDPNGLPNRNDVRNAFNAGHPRNDRAEFLDDMVSVLTAFYPAGRPGGVPNAAQATVVANLLLPDFLVFDVTNSAGFFGQLVTVNGTTFLAGGRKLSDDVISTEIAVLTDDDLPAALGGGPNPPALVTQNVRDDNFLNLTDGSFDPPAPRGHGAPGTGTQRPIAFPYIGTRNSNPSGAP